jgi:hypothetical protein
MAIEGFPEYFVSTSGEVFSNKYGELRTMRTNKHGVGYSGVSLSNSEGRTTFKVHRLVAKAFLPTYLESLQVNHINGIKNDNRVENLEMCTNSENQIHANKLRLRYIPKGERHYKSKLTGRDILEIRDLIPYFTQEMLGKLYNTERSNISIIKTDKGWRHIPHG